MYPLVGDGDNRHGIGVVDHVRKARVLNLPHVKYFDHAYEENRMTPMTGRLGLYHHPTLTIMLTLTLTLTPALTLTLLTLFLTLITLTLNLNLTLNSYLNITLRRHVPHVFCRLPAGVGLRSLCIQRVEV
jgi:hypothetical protein